jgi:single-strand DNA-binding protein
MSLPKIQGEVGRLSGDVELRFTSGGKAVCQVPLVFSKRKKNPQTNEWEDAGVLWVRGTAWEAFAEQIAESLSKGDEVIVTGELSQREYERKDGTKGTALELNLFAIGPNLKSATAKVNRVKRSSGGGGFGGDVADDDPWGRGTYGPTDDTAPF